MIYVNRCLGLTVKSAGIFSLTYSGLDNGPSRMLHMLLLTERCRHTSSCISSAYFKSTILLIMLGNSRLSRRPSVTSNLLMTGLSTLSVGSV